MCVCLCSYMYKYRRRYRYILYIYIYFIYIYTYWPAPTYVLLYNSRLFIQVRHGLHLLLTPSLKRGSKFINISYCTCCLACARRLVVKYLTSSKPLIQLLFWCRSKKRQSSESLAFLRGIHRWPVDSPHKGPVTRKMFPFDDVIMRQCCSNIIIHDFICPLWCPWSALTRVELVYHGQASLGIRNWNVLVCGWC